MTTPPGTDDSAPIRTWRSSSLGNAGLYFMGVICIALGVGLLAAQAESILAALLFFGAAAACVRLAAHGALTLTPDAVVITNLFGQRTIALTSVRRVTAGYNGLTVDTHDRRSYTALVIQKSNLSRWLGRRTRADEIADAVRSAAGLSVSKGLHHHRRDH
ncbi:MULTISPECIES: hypothetical protein [unclassified Streptomyces]|uniref:hypothetical protein n=1 Tax=unclassified Streptomyces TaxID=2593676 RepID=UPI0035D7524A